MKNNLEPRAKIGDVVIVKSYEYWNRSTDDTIYSEETTQFKVERSYLVPAYTSTGKLKSHFWHYESSDSRKPDDEISFDDKDILKNLTTNQVYGKE